MSTHMWIYVLSAVAVLLLVRPISRAAWWLIGRYLLHRAGERPVHAHRHVIWRDPGPLETLDVEAGPGGRPFIPQPPFQFVEEHSSGSQPTCAVRDALGRVWRAKWGPEVRSEAFAVRLAWACGYFAEITHFIPHGVIEGARDLQRAKDCIGDDGSFSEARFELDDPAVKKMFEEHSWAWDDNPFVGTQELTGLKILVMLISNWDTKDRRDVARGSNTAIFEHTLPGGAREARYLITDWGGAMGKWGGSQLLRGRWDPEGFVAQSEGFVTGVADGCLTFAYTGQRTADVADGIRVEHARWLWPWLDRLSDDHLRRMLMASGAWPEDAARFAGALRDRIRQIGEAIDVADATRSS